MVDLRKAKPGDIYVDRRGCKVRILCNDRKVPIFKVVALRDFNGVDKVDVYTLDGLYWACKSSYFDLVKRLDE